MTTVEEMDSSMIRRLLKSYTCFKGVFPCDQLPYYTDLPLNLIVNTDPAHEPGQHWVCVSINKEGRGYYFDSFGLPPIVPEILEFLEKRSTKGWTYNKKQIQDITSSTCGNYTVLFIIFKCNNLTPEDYLSIFGRKTLDNDIKMRKIFRNFSLVKKLL